MNFFNHILDFLYPDVCGICNKINKNSLCSKCSKKINKIIRYKLIKCKNKFFDEHLYVFKYDGIIREKIIEYKFYEKSYIYETFVKIIVKNEKKYNFLKNYDIIIPVPIYKGRKSKRGYNQSELIAKKLADYVDLVYINNVLYKKIDNKMQSSLNQKQRITNVKNVYEIKNNERIKNKNIILFDDILTTGSTTNECAKLLKKYGANKILVLTLAKD